MSYCCKETAHEECENLPVLISVLIGHIKHTQHSNNISDVHGLLSFSLACVKHRATAVLNSTDLNQHGSSTTFETKSCHCRVYSTTWFQTLSCYCLANSIHKNYFKYITIHLKSSNTKPFLIFKFCFPQQLLNSTSKTNLGYSHAEVEPAYALNSRFIILRNKFKTNRRIRFCCRKFKLTVQITEKESSYPMICFKFFS